MFSMEITDSPGSSPFNHSGLDHKLHQLLIWSLGLQSHFSFWIGKTLDGRGPVLHPSLPHLTLKRSSTLYTESSLHHDCLLFWRWLVIHKHKAALFSSWLRIFDTILKMLDSALWVVRTYSFVIVPDNSSYLQEFNQRERVVLQNV